MKQKITIKADPKHKNSGLLASALGETLETLSKGVTLALASDTFIPKGRDKGKATPKGKGLIRWNPDKGAKVNRKWAKEGQDRRFSVLFPDGKVRTLYRTSGAGSESGHGAFNIKGRSIGVDWAIA